MMLRTSGFKLLRRKMVSRFDQDEKANFAICKSKHQQSHTFVKMMVTYAVGSSMLNIFHCVCFAYVIIHPLDADWLLDAGRGR